MTRNLALITLFAAAAAAANCSPAATAEKGATPAAASAADARSIELTGADTMKFSLTEITAKPGETLRVTLVNLGTTPKFSMGHNWVLLGGDLDANAFVMAAAESATTDYVPASLKGQIIAATKLLGPNERDTVTFTAPTKPGRYVFLCSFPGHYQVGMRGVLVVG
jgi:azurin